MRSFKHLNKQDRIKLEVLFVNGKCSLEEIAEILNVHISTVYRELKRGEYYKKDWEYRTIKSYSADLAQDRYRNKLKAKGLPKKILGNLDLIEYIEDMILNRKYSPHAIIAEIKRKSLYFENMICEKTIYNYINAGIFGKLTNGSLPYKKDKRVLHRRSKDDSYINISKRSIEERDQPINDRSEFGHWEIDTVIGRKCEGDCVLTLTERKTRKEFILKMKDRSALSVVKAIDSLEEKYGFCMFRNIFKSLTSDNGNEFSFYELIERSIENNKRRTTLYYCHPYSSYERGSNENANRMIRRYLPKSTSMKDISQEDVDGIADWMNNYPRKILGDRTANDLFNEEILKLNTS